MNSDALCCDVCEEEDFYVPIIKKPLQFCIKSNIFTLPQMNADGRKQDNICLKCLTEEIELLMEG